MKPLTRPARLALSACLVLFFGPGRAAPAQAQTTYSGRAFGVYANIQLPPLLPFLPGLSVGPVTLSDTGDLPSNGGSLSASLATLQVPLLLSANVLPATTTGSGSLSSSSASVTNLSVLPGTAAALTASLVQAQSQASCADPAQASVAGSSQIVNLTLGGHPVVVSGVPNQTVVLLGGAITLVINEQVANIQGSGTAITVNALHLKVAGRADVIIASASSGIACGPIFVS